MSWGEGRPWRGRMVDFPANTRNRREESNSPSGRARGLGTLVCVDRSGLQ
jgi:hypothetical protein